MNQLLISKLISLAYALGTIIIGFYIAKRLSKFLDKPLSYTLSRHHNLIVQRITFYIIFLVFLIIGLKYLGFDLSVLLGAAGVFTVAISFAAQTAVSNLISGIFLLFERPFKIGDNVSIKGVNGTVESIDLMSTKLKTSDNQLIRIPNETLIKSEITNLSYFKERRIDLLIEVAQNTDINKAKNLLLDIAGNNALSLTEPKPRVTINSMGHSSLQLKLMVWVRTSKLSILKDALQETIKVEFEQAGIEMPSQVINLTSYMQQPLAEKESK